MQVFYTRNIYDGYGWHPQFLLSDSVWPQQLVVYRYLACMSWVSGNRYHCSVCLAPLPFLCETARKLGWYLPAYLIDLLCVVYLSVWMKILLLNVQHNVADMLMSVLLYMHDIVLANQ